MNIIYAKEELPKNGETSIFLAGPTPRSDDVLSWRPGAISHFKKAGYDGFLFVPEDRSGEFQGSYLDQIHWEWEALDAATCILFWVPRNLETMPAFTTNVEFGLYAQSEKIIFGAPKDAPKTKYLRELAKRFDISQFDTLEQTIMGAIELAEVKTP